jgi:hypothetical protein
MGLGQRRELSPDVEHIEWVVSKKTKRTRPRRAKDQSALYMQPDGPGSASVSSPEQAQNLSGANTPFREPAVRPEAGANDGLAMEGWEDIMANTQGGTTKSNVGGDAGLHSRDD